MRNAVGRLTGISRAISRLDHVEIKNDIAADRVPSADLEPFPNLPGGSGGS